MRNRISFALTLLAVCFFVGCHSSDSSSSSESLAATQPAVPIPPDSPFAKVKMGMSKEEVDATIGQPTSVYSFQTGKAWIPFHFSGSDDARIRSHYKGIGSITFTLDSAYTSRFSVMSIDYDPSDPGFEK
jgi:hypothetical protein